ncbi:hypothetical protein LXA43DRAFT_1104238 [Ganoderma leucocontextum]|nr:hypothetical protein LXA43DRAFT_1104238 [Ganoderma leucocontextum]
MQAHLTMSHRPSHYIAPRQLNDDILLFVLSLSSLQTATSMMATCHFLYHEGAKVILHDSPMSFEEKMSDDKAISLLRFIQAEHLSRCPHVRKLHVFMHPMPDFIVGTLMDLLPHLTSLDTLFASIERTLDAHPNLLPPFAALQSVETIFMISVGVHSCELVKTLQSQLVSVVIYFDPTNPTREQLSSNADFHPLVLLQRSVPTLKSLVLAFWSDMLGTMFFEPDITYPNMDSFILHKGSPMNLGSYITAFPNLVHLCVEDDCLNLWEQGQRRVAQLQRDMNLELPAHQGKPPSGMVQIILSENILQ